jgi:D-lactate dehydrogenase
MPKENIVVCEVSPGERDYLKRCPFHGEMKIYDARAEQLPKDVLRGATILSPFIYSNVSAGVLKGMPKLKLIATRSTGFEHINLTECRKRHIAVANIPYYGENTVAEHTFALILALSRKVHQAYFRTMRGDFSFEGLQGFDLKGKTIGVVGTGHIGIHVIRIARGFAMRVLAYDINRNEFMADTLGFKYVPLEKLLELSDIITLHAPYNPKTRHMINKDNINQIKRRALLINTARGGLVDTEALAQALDKGIISGAGLDVLEGEELIKEERQILSKDFETSRLRTLIENHILMNRENVVITPHMAFNSREAFMRILDTTIDNISAFLSGSPANLVMTK